VNSACGSLPPMTNISKCSLPGSSNVTLLVECALGRVPVPVTHYRTGVRSRWGWGEIDYIYLRAKLRGNGESAAGAALRAAWDVARWKPGRDRGEILRLRDPRPFVVETLRRFGLFR